MRIKAKKLLVLISPARSASTSFRNTLDAHPRIAMHGELFGQTQIQGTSNKLDLENPDVLKPGVHHRNINTQSFANIFFPNNKYLYGFNLLLGHWFLPDNFRFLDAVLHTKPKVIFLWRKNLLARLRSELIFKFDYGIITLDRLKTLTPKAVEADCEKQVLMMARIQREIISAVGSESVKTVYFEDVTSDNSQQIFIDVQKFLGVSVKKVELLQDIERKEALDRERAIVVIDKLLGRCKLSEYENYSLHIENKKSDTGLLAYINKYFSL